MTRALRLLPALALLVAALALTGCDTLQKVLTCPGQRCTRALTSARGRIAQLPGVTGVTRVEYHYGLDTGTSGLVVYRARPADDTAAKRLNRQVLAVYRKADKELAGAERVDLQLIHDPEMFVSRTDDLSTTRASAEGGATCAATRCGAQIRRLERRLRSEVATSDVTVEGARLDPQGQSGQPEVVVRLRSGLHMDRFADLTSAADRVSALAAGSGISTSYGVRVLVSHPVEHTLLTRWTAYDGFLDVPDQQATE